MERRKFVKASSIGSTCVLAGSLFPGKVVAGKQQTGHTCKITVLKKTLTKEWIEELKEIPSVRCERFKEGQEFTVSSPWSPPEGFCPWAWADIRTFIHLVNDGTFETFVTCCTDGFRPVFFKLERVEV